MAEHPLDVSGTSGMKAAHSGGQRRTRRRSRQRDVDDLYHNLDEPIVPLFDADRTKRTDVMRRAVAINASYFNTHRMVPQ